MNDFWFKWWNNSPNSVFWSFLDGGNYFELPPGSHRTEENQYDVGDRIRIAIAQDKQVVLLLTDQGWIIEHGDKQIFKLKQDLVQKVVQFSYAPAVKTV